MTKPKIVKLEATCVAGYLHKTTHSNNTIPAFWQEVFEDGRHEKLHKQDFAANHMDYGICFDEKGDADAMNYILGLAAKPGADIPVEFVQHNLAQGEYAVIATAPTTPGGAEFAANIQALWPAVYEWLENHAEYAADHEGSSFELYRCDCTDDTECQNCISGMMVCEVYVAVKHKQ